MRRLSVTFLLFVTMAANAWAQETTKGLGEIAIGGGVSLPVDEDFNDAANTGVTLGARFGAYATPRIALGGEFAWYRHNFSDELEAAASALVGTDVQGSFDVFQFTAYGKYLYLPGPTSPYLKVHLGLYRLRANAEILGESDSESVSDFGLGGGGGVQFRGQGSVGGFVDALVHVDFTQGGSTTFVSLQAGVTFLVGAAKAQ